MEFVGVRIHRRDAEDTERIGSSEILRMSGGRGTRNVRGEFPEEVTRVEAVQGSFDYVRASLCELLTPLRMTSSEKRLG